MLVQSFVKLIESGACGERSEVEVLICNYCRKKEKASFQEAAFV